MNRRTIHTFIVAGLASGLLASKAAAQMYQDAQGRSTPRREASFLDIGRIMGEGEDWLDYPVFDLSFNTQFEYDFTHFNGNGHSNNLVNTSDLSFTLLFAPRLALFSDMTLDQINGPNPGQDSWLEGEGIFSSDLFLQYSDQFFTLGGGQFTPNFGIANALAPGVYGGDFVGDYSFDDQIGLFTSLDFGREQIGRHIFSASLFMVDTSFLSKSIITSNGGTSRSDGGPGNSGSLESFTLTYDGVDVPICDMPILQYQLGFISQAEGEGDTGRQYGFVAGAAITIPLDRNPYATVANRYQAIQPLIEYAHFENWTGVDGATADYFTAGVDYFYGDWDFSMAGTTRSIEGLGAGDADDYMITAAVGYQLYGYQALGGNGQVSFGWAYSEQGRQDQHVFGIVLSLGWDMFNDFQIFRGW